MKSNLGGLSGVILVLYPQLMALRKLKHRLFGRKQKKFLALAFQYFRETIQEHRKTMEEGNPRDFIDTYLDEINKTTDPTSSFYAKDETDGQFMHSFQYKSWVTVTLRLVLQIPTLLLHSWIYSWPVRRPLVRHCSGFASSLRNILKFKRKFIRRSKTSSEIVKFCWLIAQGRRHKISMMSWSSAFKRLELILIVRPNSLPYFEATTLEILRFATLAPLGAPHAITEDTTFKGYFLPKGTFVWANIYSAHKNPKYWTEPEKFNPEWFLADDGKTVVRPKSWMPFGVGKRACMGESLARDELFLFATNLIHNLKIGMPSDEPPHTFKEHFGIAFVPEPHRILLQERA